jgi:hypothetical protein
VAVFGNIGPGSSSRVIQTGTNCLPRDLYPQSGQRPSANTAQAAVGGSVTWNPADKTSNCTLSNGNLTAELAGGNIEGVRATGSGRSDKFYFEVSVDAVSAFPGIGVADASALLNTNQWIGNSGNNDGILQARDGTLFHSNGSTTGFTFTTGDIIGVAIDQPNGLAYFSKGGTWQLGGDPAAGTGGISFTSSGPLYPALQAQSGDSFLTGRFTAASQSSAAPTGFTAYDSGAGASSVTATASPSLASFTTTSTAKVLVKAAAAPALASFSLSSVTKVKVKASASPALNTFLSAAAAKALVHGLGSGTLNAFTSTAVAKVKVKASASPSLANFTGSATAAVKVKAAASITPNAFTSAAADRILVKGAGSGILSAFGTTSTARVRVKAAAAPTLGLFTTTAVADVISANINAAASITLSPFVSAAAAKALVEGVGSGTLNPFTASASAKAKVRADASLVLDAFTGTAQAAVRIKAAATISCGPFTLTARLASLSDYPAGPFSDERVAIVGRGSRQAAVANDSGLRTAKVARRA